MSDQLDKKSILEMSMGAILERVDYEMGKVMDNILDPNTKATAGPRDHEPLHHQRTQHRRAAGGRNGAPGPRPVGPRR